MTILTCYYTSTLSNPVSELHTPTAPELPAAPLADNAYHSGLAVSVSCADAHVSAVLNEAAMKSNILICIMSSVLVVLAIFFAVYHSLVFLYYKVAEFDQNMFLRELTAIDPTARVTSIDLVSSQLASSVAQSFLWSFLVGGVLELFLMITHFESKLGMLYTFFPVAAGALLMLGSMAIFGMGINFMNAMVLVTIVGMGSDYGLHIIHRVNSGDDSGSEGRFVQAGRAVFISAMTTIGGFGSLAFADYPALASIGWATNLGVGFTALCALLTLPAILVVQRSAGNS